MKRNRFLISLLFVSLFSFQNFSQTKSKQSQKDLESKKKKINDEINEINSMLNQTKDDKRNSIGALININVKLEKRQELIALMLAEVRALTKEINLNEQEINHLKSNLEKLKEEYAQMIVFAQRNKDAYNTLMFIFASENFSQAYARLKYIQQYSDYRKKQAREILFTQTEILSKLNELKEQRTQKNSLLGIEEKEKQTLNVEKKEKEDLVSDLQKKEKDLKSQLQRKKQAALQLQISIRNLIEAEIRRKAEEANRAELARLMAAKKAKEEQNKTGNASNKNEAPTKNKEENKTSKPENNMVPVLTEEAEALSEDFSNNRGKLPWPVIKGVICETYGEHEHPAIPGFMMFNNGLEICVNKGTQARAVFDGEVTSIAVSPTGGKLVIVRHGEYLSVYCNLDEVRVKTGEKIKVKQEIGSVRYNEDEDKTSINIQIWKGQKTMDPTGWLFNAK